MTERYTADSFQTSFKTAHHTTEEHSKVNPMLDTPKKLG